MSRPSSTSTSSNAFPKQAGSALLSPEKVGEQLSPSPSQFSFASSPHSIQEAEAERNRPYNTAGHGLRPMTSTSRARAQFYEDQFSYKDGIVSSARERVTKDAPIVAELRTNVIINDEYTLVTDLSHHLSMRYQRPETSIMITVNHSACLLLGGSFEPTYILTINALPVQVQPTTNKRNASLIQTFMAESIGVSPDRGIIKFIPIPEESLAMNGMTILGDIERMERQTGEDSNHIKRAVTKSSRKSVVAKAKSSMQLSRGLSKADPVPRAVVAAEPIHDGPLDSGVAVNEQGMNEKPSDVKLTNKKSEPMLSLMGKKNASRPQSRATTAAHPPPPPIPASRPTTPAISKRKSFMSVFRR
ncbi:MIF domain containing protein [Pyrenophora tritici-repentis Pt-1C-BFP]|nr:MIF domain containing protein [Pyrenophora tritici-repentis Pt-1C-BFP]KAI1509572.1 MIF domain containing protein [Pyrenophora tritici-repentis]EDU43242.1 MIF domain containing protein [Pyrenophora tritici-repentis Pt-1C-BFP]KAI1684613.1 MIF domain containing protein [Pyrenophora tritici-repentis]PWO29480.1 low temperature requirement a protein [Pyrenophora tritici-repentis]PZC91433.1 MIF domain containing protein [Pyrenophora tritici-repentis]